MLRRRTAVAATFLALALAVCGGAPAENYRYAHSSRDDRLAASTLLRKTDFPAQLRLSGGRTKPDETATDATCDGKQPKQSDLVITGDAETRFANAPQGILQLDSEVQAFKTEAMARTDFARQLPFLTARCGAEIMKHEHTTLVKPWHVTVTKKCICDEMVTMTFETTTSRPDLHVVWVVSGVRVGRFEATIVTMIGKSPSDTQHVAENAALGLHTRSLEAVGQRLLQQG